MKYKLCTRAMTQNASETGGRYKLLLWSSLCEVYPFEYDTCCIIFPLNEEGGQEWGVCPYLIFHSL